MRLSPDAHACTRIRYGEGLGKKKIASVVLIHGQMIHASDFVFTLPLIHPLSTLVLLHGVPKPHFNTRIACEPAASDIYFKCPFNHTKLASRAVCLCTRLSTWNRAHVGAPLSTLLSLNYVCVIWSKVYSTSSLRGTGP